MTLQTDTNKNMLTPESLVQALLGSHLQAQCKVQGSGSTVKHLPLPVCRSLYVRVPPIALQRRFSDVAETLDRMGAREEQSLSLADDVFSTLVQGAFHGELTGPGSKRQLDMFEEGTEGPQPKRTIARLEHAR